MGVGEVGRLGVGEGERVWSHYRVSYCSCSHWICINPSSHL